MSEAHPQLLKLLALLRREHLLDFRVRRFDLRAHVSVPLIEDFLDLHALLRGEIEMPVEMLDDPVAAEARRMPAAAAEMQHPVEQDAGEHAGDERRQQDDRRDCDRLRSITG
jgi:hypothetical protein